MTFDEFTNNELKKDFRKRYKKNIATCDKLVKEHKGIYGATLWSGRTSLPQFLSFDLDEVMNYLFEHTNWDTHPDLARVEFINFGKNPEQEIVGYFYTNYYKDGYLDF